MELFGFVLLVLVVFLIAGLVTGNLFYVVNTWSSSSTP